tara:strand:- start:1387 stop:2976 length:1590 start_codon:yes stop_codon:yes gene_type:complete
MENKDNSNHKALNKKVSNLMSFIFRLGAGAIIVMTVLVILELLLESFYSKTGSSISRPSLCCGYEPKSNIKEGPYLTDDRGFRLTPYDFRVLPPEKVYKIVFLGGSIIFGKSNSGLLSIPGYFEFLINSPEFKPNLPDDKSVVEVVNAAVYGYSSTHVLNRLKAKILNLDPDMVIISVGSNDIPFLRLFRFNYFLLRYLPTLYWYIKSSATSSFLKNFLKPVIQLVQSNAIDRQPDNTGFDSGLQADYSIYGENLRRIGKLLKKKGVKTVFMPWSQIPLKKSDDSFHREKENGKNRFLKKEYKKIYIQMQTVALEMGIPLVSNPFQTPVIPPKKNASDFLTTRFHLNNYGSKIVARSLVEAVSNILKDKPLSEDVNGASIRNFSLLDAYWNTVRDVEKKLFFSEHQDTERIMRWILDNEKEIAIYFILKHHRKDSGEDQYHPTEALFSIVDTGYYLHLAGKDKEAKQYLEWALRIAPDHPYVNFIIGIYKMEKKNYARAKFFFEKATRLESHFKAPREYLAKLPKAQTL